MDEFSSPSFRSLYCPRETIIYFINRQISEKVWTLIKNEKHILNLLLSWYLCVFLPVSFSSTWASHWGWWRKVILQTNTSVQYLWPRKSCEKRWRAILYWKEACQTLWDMNCSHTNWTSDFASTLYPLSPTHPPPAPQPPTKMNGQPVLQIRPLKLNSYLGTFHWCEAIFDPHIWGASFFVRQTASKGLHYDKMLPSAELCTLKDLRLYIWEPRTWHILSLRPPTLCIIRNEKNLSQKYLQKREDVLTSKMESKKKKITIPRTINLLTSIKRSK